jgi:hypothetical protein
MVEQDSYVAVMPSLSSPEEDVIEIMAVLLAGSVYVQLMDGRMYATIGGRSLGARKVTYIVPATDGHRAALRTKHPASVA